MGTDIALQDTVLQGTVLPALFGGTDSRNSRLHELTQAWLRSHPSVHSREAYKRDLEAWIAWCTSRGIHPLDAHMMDMDEWISAQRDGTLPAWMLAPSSSSRRGQGRMKLSDEKIGLLYARWQAGEASQRQLAAQAGVSPTVLSRRFARLAEGASTSECHPQATASIARRVYAIRSWYDYLITDTAFDPCPLVEHNPAKTKSVPKVSKDDSPTIGLSRAESDRLIAAADADGPRSAAIIRLLLTNGERVGMIESMKVTDLGHERGYRVITRTIKGGGKVRDPIPAPTAEAIDAYLASRGNPTQGPLFVTRTGGRYYQRYVRSLVPRLARKAGIPSADHLTPHSLRATAISETIEVTGDLTLAQDLAHHADPRTTQGYNKRRRQLDRHASHILATRYGVRNAEEGS